MDQYDQQLNQYIQSHLQAGTTLDAIRQSLIQGGWDAGRVDAALQQYAGQPPQPAQQAVQQTGQSPQQAYGQPAAYAAQSATAPYSGAQNAPQKYKVFQAIADTFRAIKNNAAAYFLSALITGAVAFGLIILEIVLFSVLVLSHIYGSSSLNLTALIVSLIGLVLISFLVYGFAMTLIQVTSAVALYDGIEGRKTSVKSVLVSGMHKVPHVIVANMWVALVATAPLLVAVVVGFITAVAGAQMESTRTLLNIVSILVGIGGVVWAVIAVFRFLLVPYVAIFEPEVPARQTLARSYHLMQKGGYWFVIKAELLTFAVIIVLSFITGFGSAAVAQNSSSAGLGAVIANSVIQNVISVLISILATGVLVMFYHNRRAVRAAATQ